MSEEAQEKMRCEVEQFAVQRPGTKNAIARKHDIIFVNGRLVEWDAMRRMVRFIITSFTLQQMRR